jgi:hypothetical protein
MGCGLRWRATSSARGSRAAGHDRGTTSPKSEPGRCDREVRRTRHPVHFRAVVASIIVRPGPFSGRCGVHRCAPQPAAPASPAVVRGGESQRWCGSRGSRGATWVIQDPVVATPWAASLLSSLQPMKRRSGFAASRTGGRATTPPRAAAGERMGAGPGCSLSAGLAPLVPVLVPVRGRSGENSVERGRSRNLTQVRWRPRVSEDRRGDHSSPSNRLRTCRSPVRIGPGALTIHRLLKYLTALEWTASRSARG